MEYKDSRPQNHRALFPPPPPPARGRGFGVDSISRDAPRGGLPPHLAPRSVSDMRPRSSCRSFCPAPNCAPVVCRLYAVYASRDLRTQQNILFAAFKRRFARHVFALSALFCIFNVLSVYQSKASAISPNPPRIRSCTSPDALTSFLSTSAAPSKSWRWLKTALFV